MNILMLSCRKATELVEKKLDNKLSILEKVQLYMHTRMCNACRHYEQQSKLIDEALKRHANGSSKEIPKVKPLSNEMKEKIIRDLHKQ